MQHINIGDGFFPIFDNIITFIRVKDIYHFPFINLIFRQYIVSYMHTMYSDCFSFWFFCIFFHSYQPLLVFTCPFPRVMASDCVVWPI